MQPKLLRCSNGRWFRTAERRSVTLSAFMLCIIKVLIKVLIKLGCGAVKKQRQKHKKGEQQDAEKAAAGEGPDGEGVVGGSAPRTRRPPSRVPHAGGYALHGGPGRLIGSGQLYGVLISAIHDDSRGTASTVTSRCQPRPMPPWRRRLAASGEELGGLGAVRAGGL